MSYEVKKEAFGDEGLSELIIMRNGSEVERHSDGGEPEDNYYFRDWRWVKIALEAAYKYGLEDARKETKHEDMD